MSDRAKKRDSVLEQEALGDIAESSFHNADMVKSNKARAIDVKRITKVSPLGMRVLVKMRRENNVSEGGLFLPEGAKQNMSESVLAEVLEVASAIDQHTEEEANISGIPLGALVLIGKTAGVRVPWDDTLRLVETKEVLALVHEMAVS